MDTKCVVCGEPWDYYGARHGDMAPWEFKLFSKGAGCPRCEGVRPTNGGFEPQTIFDLDFGDEDPALRLNAYEDSIEGKTPKWKKPEPTVFWTCDGCGVQVINDVDLKPGDEGYLKYHIPHDAICRQWYHSHPFWKGTPEKEPEHIFESAQQVCEFCVSHCYNCGKNVSSLIEASDVYDDGWCTTLEAYGYTDVFCIDCVESTCGECNSLPDDCNCVYCKECDEHLGIDDFDAPETCPHCGTKVEEKE